MEFDRIYELYFRDVYLYLRSISAREDVAEELTQETFVKALKHIQSFDGSKDIRAWLFTIAKNTYLNEVRRSKHYADQELDADLTAADLDIEQQFADEEHAFRIHQFLHQMQEPYKEVFSLRVFGELSFDRIGQLFGKSSGWARVTYYRAKKQIAEYMEKM